MTSGRLERTGNRCRLVRHHSHHEAGQEPTTDAPLEGTMRKPILLHHYGTTWSHPYGAAPFGVLYADGGDGDGSDSTSDGGGDAGGTGDTDTGAGGGDDAGAAGDSTGAATDTGAGAGSSGEDLAAKVARLEKELKGANAEAGKARTDAKKKAADEERARITKELGKVLGLVEDDKDAAPDPAKLTAEITRATAAHRETAVELAVFKRAARGGADPDALTDSRAFLAKLKDLDPAADDFTKKLDKAIAEAVSDNPKLKASGTATAAAAAVSDFTGGDGEPDKATQADDIDKIRAERRKRRAG